MKWQSVFHVSLCENHNTEVVVNLKTDLSLRLIYIIVDCNIITSISLFCLFKIIILKQPAWRQMYCRSSRYTNV